MLLLGLSFFVFFSFFRFFGVTSFGVIDFFSFGGIYFFLRFFAFLYSFGFSVFLFFLGSLVLWCFGIFVFLVFFLAILVFWLFLLLLAKWFSRFPCVASRYLSFCSFRSIFGFWLFHLVWCSVSLGSFVLCFIVFFLFSFSFWVFGFLRYFPFF